MGIQNNIGYKLLSLILISIAFNGFTQMGVIWDLEAIPGNGDTYGKTRPRLALTQGEKPVIVFGNTNGLFVARWSGSMFETPVAILPAGLQTYIADWTGPDIAAKGDTVFVVYKAMPLETGGIYSVRSFDGGITFSDTIRVDDHPNGVAWMPSLDVDDQGNPVVSYMVHDINWSNPSYAISKSFDHGMTFEPEINLTSAVTNEVCDCCPSEYVIDGSRQVLLYRNNDNNTRDIFGLLSLDSGNSFPFSANVDNTNWVVNSCPSTGPHACFVGDTLVTAYVSGSSGNYRLYVSVSDVSLGLAPVAGNGVSDPSWNQNFPRIAASNDTVVLAWRSYNGPQSRIEVAVGNGVYESLISNGIPVNEESMVSLTNPDVKIAQGRVHLCYQNNTLGEVIYKTGLVGDVAGMGSLDSKNSIYPNPVSDDELTLQVDPNPLACTLVDPLGRSQPLRYTTSSKSCTVDLRGIPNGWYMIVVDLANGTQIQSKLLIDKL